ncbi:tetratricopeptide repeat-containing protein [Thermodesulfobacteriota bacterium]
MGNQFKRILLIALLLITFPAVAYSQKASYDQLNQQLATLYKKGQIDDAIKIAEKALKVAEDTFGEKHPYVSASLNNIALLYMAQREYEKAESYYEKSLKIAEELLGENHLRLIDTLEKIAQCYEELGKYDKADSVKDRIENIEDMNS